MVPEIYSGIPFMVNRLPYTFSFDEIVFADANHTICVERWRIDYYMQMISSMLNTPQEYQANYFEMILNMIDQPEVWEYFDDESRRQVEAEIIDPFKFSDYAVSRWKIVPSIFVYDSQFDGKVKFRQFEIGNRGIFETLKLVFLYMDNRERKAVDEYLEVEDARSERDAIISELRQRIEELQSTIGSYRENLLKMGFDNNDVEFALKDVEYKMPKMYILIDKKNRIYLSPYNYLVPGKDIIGCTEVKLAPLDKALYFLYLKHPEGIHFSYLSDYRDELLEIYRSLMNCRTSREMEKSVDDLIDPTNNSVNEKCARIRRAFVNVLGKLKAEPYIIKGPRGEKKSIDIDRKNVVFWQEERF